jgi:hypothetical protein
MAIEISHEIEVRLAEEARRQGISVDALLQRLMSERAASPPGAQPSPELPVCILAASVLSTAATSTTMPVEPGALMCPAGLRL